MKNKITNLKSALLKLGFLVSMAFWGVSASAQAPWCSAPGTNACGWVNGANTWLSNTIEAVNIRQNGVPLYSKAADGCNNAVDGALDYALINPTSSIAISAGGSYEITITIGGNNQKRIGIYVDLNRDFDFNDAGEWLNPLTANAGWVQGSPRTITLIIPCTGLVAGASRLRIRASATQMNGLTGCNTSLFNGETEDFNITLNSPTSLSANFVVPALVYTANDYQFINTSQAAIFSNQWDRLADGTVDAFSNNYTTNFVVPSTQQRCIKLRSENCLGRDSITKCFNVIVPTVVPSVDFIANKTTVDLFGTLKLNDITEFGPTSWAWEVFDSSANPVKNEFSGAYFYVNGTSNTSKNPEILFLNSGSYTVCLVARNGVGFSPRVCKRQYIRVLPLREFTVGAGPTQTDQPKGILYDHNGPGANYTASRDPNTDKFLINPCGATQIDFVFSQIKFGTGRDSLFIYAGENAAAPRVGAIGRGTAVPYRLSVMGGAAYLTFQSDGLGQDSGFTGTFNSILGPQVPPVTSFELPNIAYFGVEIDIKNNSTNELGIPTYNWDIFEPASASATDNYTTEDIKHTFLTTGPARVCLTVDGCAGSNTSCKDIDVQVPSSPTSLDFVASNRRPNTGSTIKMTTTADKANKFLWSVFPNATITNPTDKNPTVTFAASGPYTFTLRAWNTIDSSVTVTTIVKDKYVVVVDYCKPVVTILSADVAIENFTVSKSGVTLLSKTTDFGNAGYNDYSSTDFMKGTYGASYNFTITRPSTVDPANARVWVDFNLDGLFAPSELVSTFPSSNSKVLTGSFTVPDISKSFIGNGRIRVSIAYGNTANTACGPLVSGEVEDYGIKLDNDMMPPMIALVGADTIFVERVIPPATPNYVDAGAIATDGTEGDISANIVVTTDFDQTTAGIYTYTYCITDASGNGPVCITRTMFVVLDRTAPVLTLNGTNVILEVDGPFVDQGATANDNVDGVLTPSIRVTGAVNNAVLGTYVLTYTVSDVQGNMSIVTRTVSVIDTKVPVITAIGSDRIQINTIWADQTVVSDNYYNSIRGAMVALVGTPGANGLPNTTVRASYPVEYTATDGSGNQATPVLRNYVVDDFIPPTIDLKTLDTVFHRVNTPYFSTQPQVTDNFYNNTSVSISKVSTVAVDASTLGTYRETYVAVDGSGNRDTAIRFVKVIDDLAPVIFAPAINACVGSDINNMSDLQISDNYDAPADLISSVRFIQNNVNIYNAGVYSMTYEIEDLSGNVSAPFVRQVYLSYCAAGVVSVKTINLEELTSVYPNPSNGTINVSVNGVSNQAVTVTVYNALGAEVATATNANGNTIALDLQGHAVGIYTVKVSTGGETTTRKVVLTK